MDLKRFFEASSIAIIGVSYDEKKVGYLVAQNLIAQGYKGELYFINKEPQGSILNQKVYATLAEVQKPVDLVVLAIPAKPAIEYLDEVHKLGVKNVVIFAAGFKEIGEDGKANEEALQKKISDLGLQILGPNCIGFINTANGINTTFLKHTSPKGNIGLISQSGALGSVIVDHFAAHANLGFSIFASLGNKSNISEIECLEYCATDPHTEVIGLYLEDIRDGKRFMEVASRVSKSKPVVVLKSGRTKEGSQAALSHTGGLVGDDDVYTAAFKQAGVIRADSVDEFLKLLTIYSYKAIPTSASVLILSNAGGMGVLVADEMIQQHLILPHLSEEVQKQIIAGEGTKHPILRNPVDLLGDASAFDYQHALSCIKAEKGIGSVVILLTPQANTEVEKTASEIIKLKAEMQVPMYPVFIGDASTRASLAEFEKYNIPGFLSYELLSNCIAKIIWRTEQLSSTTSVDSVSTHLQVTAGQAQIQSLLEKNRNKPFLNLFDSTTVLSLLQLPVLPLRLIQSESELEQAARELGYPLVVKIASDIITHKTEVGGVRVGVTSLDELQKIFHEFVSTGKSRGIYLQRQVQGNEIFIGAKRDSHFGTVLATGLGGIYAELLHEVNNVIYPFTFEQFENEIKNTKLEKLLSGFRGTKSVDPKALFYILSMLGNLLEVFPQIKELDLNPVFVSSNGLLIADSRIILA